MVEQPVVSTEWLTSLLNSSLNMRASVLLGHEGLFSVINLSYYSCLLPPQHTQRVVGSLSLEGELCSFSVCEMFLLYKATGLVTVVILRVLEYCEYHNRCVCAKTG